ncbi:ABC transporter permease [Balneolaceae bacterium ANBcel3]|nr:ABC transporter permease [Balneolaceae bacterium ANBcel3]
MNFLRDFIQSINKQRLRTFLTLFGILWGTASLIILLAFGVGFQNQMMTTMRGLGEQIVILFGSRTTQAYEGYGIGRSIQFRESDALAIRQNVAGVEHVAAEYVTWNAVLRRGDQRNSPQFTGVPVVYGEMRNIFAQEGGRWINQRDVDERRKVVFIGDHLKELLFGDEEAVGQQIFVNATPFTVIGVMQPKSQDSSYGQRDMDRAFIPKTTFSSLFGTDRLNNIIYTVQDPGLSSEVQQEILELLARRHRFDPADSDAVFFWDTSEFWDFLKMFFLGFNIFMGGIGAVTLGVGGIGVANIMFVVVQERMKEIGIRRAAGAKRNTILLHFFGETFLLVGIGAAIGYTIGWGIIASMQHVMNYVPIQEFVGTPVFSPVVGVAAFVVLAFIGLTAGSMPAYRASRLNIVECLR